MRIVIPPITKPIQLSEYAEELGDLVVHVWVNPPSSFMVRFFQLERSNLYISKEEADNSLVVRVVRNVLNRLGIGTFKRRTKVGQAYINWFSELWSKHSDTETHFSPKDIEALISQDLELGSSVYKWLTQKSIVLISEHRSALKKVLPSPSSTPRSEGKQATVSSVASS